MMGTTYLYEWGEGVNFIRLKTYISVLTPFTGNIINLYDWILNVIELLFNLQICFRVVA